MAKVSCLISLIAYPKSKTPKRYGTRMKKIARIVNGEHEKICSALNVSRCARYDIIEALVRC